MPRYCCARNHLHPADRAGRPRYDPLNELRVEVLTVLADRMAWAARRGDIPGWCLWRAWAEVVLAWAVDHGP